MKRQADAYHRPQDLTRDSSAPFITKLAPSEAAWDTRNTSKGVNTKLVEMEKTEAMEQGILLCNSQVYSKSIISHHCMILHEAGAEWDYELYLLQQEKLRKKAKQQAGERKRKEAEEAQRIEVIQNSGKPRPYNERFDANPYIKPPPNETRAKVRPKSAGHAGFRSKQSKSETILRVERQGDSSGGYYVGPHEPPIVNSQNHPQPRRSAESHTAARPSAPPGPPPGRPTRRDAADAGNCYEGA